MKRIFVFVTLAILAGWNGGASARGATLDTNFTESVFVANAGSEVTGLAWAPDGSNRLFVSRKGGVIAVVKNGVLLPAPFAILSPIFLNSECGLIGICSDPNFIVNQYLYVFVTVSGSQQQIIRYRAVGDRGTNKTVIIPNLPTVGQNHDGGAVGVGPDGKLYWAVGDNGNGTGVDANLTVLASKVGRANLDGSVPADNPFVDGAGPNNDYIWARGFRNPFTFTFQPTTGALWVNCVGTSYEQIFLVAAGDHAGWNDFENNQPAGFIKPKIKYRTNGTDTRNLAAGTGAIRLANTVTFTTTSVHGFRQGETITIAGVTDTNFNGDFYVASVPTATTFTVAQAGADATSGGGTATTLNQGGAVSGGCFYDSTGVPESYRGNFFYGDFNSGRVMRATLNESNDVTSVDYFVTGVANHIDTSVGPDGALYYVGFGGTIRRLAYNFTSQQIVVTPSNVRMVEGGLAAITIRLAQAPTQDVAVAVGPTGGQTNVVVVNGSMLIFGPTNWSVPQIVGLQAFADSDVTNSVTTLSISATGLPAETVTVHALDREPQPFSVEPVTRQIGSDPAPIAVGLNGEPGRTYVLEASTNLTSPWTPVVTHTLTGSSTNITDSDSTNLMLRFYRGRNLP